MLAAWPEGPRGRLKRKQARRLDCCHHGPPWFPWRGAEINFYIWCAVGAVVGGMAGLFIGSKTRVTRIEEVSEMGPAEVIRSLEGIACR